MHDEVGEEQAATDALEEAHALEPSNRVVLGALRDGYTKSLRWSRVLEVLSTPWLTATESGNERGALRFEAADVALRHLRDEDAGLALLERVLDDDPTHDPARQAVVAIRASRNHWSELDALYTRLVDRLAQVGDVERAWDACRKLGALRRDKTHDVDGAVDAFSGAVRCKPSDVDSRAMLAEMHLARGDERAALTELEHNAEHAPMRTSTYARLFALHQRAGRVDRAWLTGIVLEELGAADMDHQILVNQYRPEGPLRPSRSLDDKAWDEFLRAPGTDDVIADVLRAVVDAAVAAHVEELREARKLVPLDPARRQNAQSTVSAVRSLHWAAQVLGIETPDLYALEGDERGMRKTREKRAALAAGARSAIGREHAPGFARPSPSVERERSEGGPSGGTVDGARAGHSARAAGEGARLFGGAPSHVLPARALCARSLSDHQRAIGPLSGRGQSRHARPSRAGTLGREHGGAGKRQALTRHASEAEKKIQLEEAVQRLNARGGRVDLAAWIRSVELTAQRAGLAPCAETCASRSSAVPSSRTALPTWPPSRCAPTFSRSAPRTSWRAPREASANRRADVDRACVRPSVSGRLGDRKRAAPSQERPSYGVHRRR